MDHSLDINDSFLTWEQVCEDSKNKIEVGKEISHDGYADDENDSIYYPEIKKKPITVSTPITLQRGSCNYLTNLMDQNTAIVDLNDTLEAVEYILTHANPSSDEDSSKETSIISISSANSSDKSIVFKNANSFKNLSNTSSIEEETVPQGFYSAAVLDMTNNVSPVQAKNIKNLN